MQTIKTKTFAIITGCLLFFNQQDYAQCSQINIIAPGENPIMLQYDGNGRLVTIAGTDEEEGATTMKFSVQRGLSLPTLGQKGVTWSDNGDGGFLITTGSGEDDEDEIRSHFKISKEGKLLAWDLAHEGGLKTTVYTYNANGDLATMTWEGTMLDTKVTDKGQLTATFNTAKPDVILKGAPMIFMVEAAWQIFPMTNSHQITSLTYTQTIHTPETKKEVGYDKEKHEPIYKTIPAKDIKNVVTRIFSYTYDASGRVTSITVTGKGLGFITKTFRVTYGNCIKVD